jgi:hypothetical protein
MIDLIHNRVVRGDIDEPITRWTVYFKTPFGYVENISELLKVMEENQLDSNMASYPVPVAVTQTTYEVYER